MKYITHFSNLTIDYLYFMTTNPFQSNQAFSTGKIGKINLENE